MSLLLDRANGPREGRLMLVGKPGRSLVRFADELFVNYCESTIRLVSREAFIARVEWSSQQMTLRRPLPRPLLNPSLCRARFLEVDAVERVQELSG
jgi:hypothetical protein